MVQALCHFSIGYKTYHYEVKPPGIRRGALPSVWQKSLAEFAARRRQRNKIIFSRDLCVRENTSQAASVDF